MNKPRPLLCGFILIIMLLAALTVNFYAPVIDGEPEVKAEQETAAEPTNPILTMQAEAFSTYGWDTNGIDYGPGYAIISTESEIPLCSLLVIDQYGEAQAIATSDELAPDEIKLWYNAPSKVPMFGRQTVQVKIVEKGDTPCSKY